jgi:hypothetical protein
MKASVFLVVTFMLFGGGCRDSKSPYINEGDVTNPPSIDSISISACKNFPSGIPAKTATADQDCMEYLYVGGDVLELRHINAGFNCCPILDFEVSVQADTITIEEIQIEGQCSCLCLFDVDFEIQDLSPGVYHVVVIEPYRPEADPVLEFTIDLDASPSGRTCVPRTQYPWRP